MKLVVVVLLALFAVTFAIRPYGSCSDCWRRCGRLPTWEAMSESADMKKGALLAIRSATEAKLLPCDNIVVSRLKPGNVVQYMGFSTTACGKTWHAVSGSSSGRFSHSPTFQMAYITAEVAEQI
jgi:hypothetical protein